MIDPNNPLSERIYRAAGLLDGVLLRIHEMSVSPSSVRADLLAECLPLFAAMRELNVEQFSQSPWIDQAICECEASTRALAALGNSQITQDQRSGEGDCVCCGTEIHKHLAIPAQGDFADYYEIYCGRCAESVFLACGKLDCLNGFGTCVI
jgi:hypothetical protein